MDKAILTCALTGVLTDPKQHPVPVTAQEMAAAAREAGREAKASRARAPRHEKSFFEILTENTMVRQMARPAAREITRSIFGTGRRR